MKLISIEPPVSVNVTLLLGLLILPNCWSNPQDISAIGGDPSCKELQTTLLPLIAVGRSADVQTLISRAVSQGRSTCAGLILVDIAASAAVSRRPADAEALAERSVKLLEIDNAVNRAVLLRPLQLMCVASLDSGHVGKARRAYDRMLQVAGDTPADRYLVHSAAARLLDHQEKFKDAEIEILAAIEVLQRTERASRGDEAALFRSLSLVRISQRNYAGARTSMESASAILEIAKDFDPIDRVDTLHVWAILHAKTRDWRKAEQDLREALAIVDEGNRTDPAFLRTLLLRYAEALRHIHRGREARAFEKRASTLVDPAAANALVDVSELYRQSSGLR